MSRAEIRKKFDEIVAFAETEKFLDTPVKRYSSGMYVRLAFAVAAHLEPEILVVDEVLAVGDAEFQKKCLGKMREVSKGGRTVLFVSHNMAAVQNLCRSAMMIRKGRLTVFGPTADVISVYLADAGLVATDSLASRNDREGSAAIRFSFVRFRSGRNESSNALVCGDTAVIEMHFENYTGEDLPFVNVGIGIDNHFGQRIACLDSEWVNQIFKKVPADVRCVEIGIPHLPLAPGRYGFTLYASVNGIVADWIKNAGFFDVDPGDFYGTGKLPPPEQGFFLMSYRFSLK
jgi:lipopolysaccharide transport system ATP-binding protein